MRFKYFSPETDRNLFFDSENGSTGIKDAFVLRLDDLRAACGFAFTITSGYRSPQHSAEVVKEKPGTHTQGIAADIVVNGGVQRRILTEQALIMGFGGIGIAKTFVHVDDRKTTKFIWVY